MRISLARRVSLFVVSMALAAALAPQPALASPAVLGAVHVGPQKSGALVPDVFEAVLTAEGKVVRRSAGLNVERVRVPAALRSLHPDSPECVWKVTLSSPNQLGGAVTAGGMSMFGRCSDIWATPCVPSDLGWLDVHLSYPSWSYPLAATLPRLQQGLLGWPDHNGAVRFDIPAGEGDVSGFDAFQFRAATNPGCWSNQPGDIQDLAAVLADGSGHSVSLNASDVGNDALAHRFSGERYPFGHYILNQVRFPLDMFPGVDLTNIRSVELRFSRTEIGLIDVADLAFTSGV